MGNECKDCNAHGVIEERINTVRDGIKEIRKLLVGTLISALITAIGFISTLIVVLVGQ